jgi:hypothetical protein
MGFVPSKLMFGLPIWRYRRLQYYLGTVISILPSQLRLWADFGKRDTIFGQRQDTEFIFVVFTKRVMQGRFIP